jgi:hypothetical protein
MTITKTEIVGILLIVFVIWAGGCVEPCDGHSCDAEVMQDE